METISVEIETSSRLDTCKHRSASEEVRVIQRCSCQGGNYEQKGYFCNARQLFNVTEEICKNCSQYAAK